MKTTILHLVMFVSLLAITEKGLTQHSWRFSHTTLPEPIRTSEVQAIAEAIDMTVMQRLELIRIQNQYRSQLTAEQSLLLDNFEKVDGNSEERLHPLVFARWNQLQIADARYFDKIRNFLTELQCVALERIRRYRQRKLNRVYNNTYGYDIRRWDSHDFPSLMQSADVPETLSSEFNSILDTYDVEYTSTHTSLSHLAQDTWNKMKLNRKYVSHKFDESIRTSKPKARDSAIRERMRELLDLNYLVLNKFTKAVADHRQKTWDTLHILCALLPEDESKRLTREYVRQSYPLIRGVDNEYVQCLHWIKYVLEIENLQNDIKLEVEELKENVVANFDLIINEIILLINKHNMEVWFERYAKADRVNTFNNKLSRLQRRGLAIKADSLEKLQSLFPSKNIESHSRPATSIEKLKSEKYVNLNNKLKTNKLRYFDYVLPIDLDTHHLLAIVSQLDSGRLAKSDLVGEAINKFNLRLKRSFTPKRKRLSDYLELYSPPYNRSEITQVKTLTKQSLDELKQTEESFFKALLSYVEDENISSVVQHLRARRGRERLVPAALKLYVDATPYFDVVDILCLTFPALLYDAQIKQILHEYEVKSLPLLEQLYTKSTEFSLGLGAIEDSQTISEDLMYFKAQLTSLNRETLHTIVLIYTDAPKIRRELLRTAYPNAYSDTSEMLDEFWAQLLGLDNLTSESLITFQKTKEHYHSTCTQLTEGILNNLRQVADEDQELEQVMELQLLTKDLEELNASTVFTLRQLLDNEQLLFLSSNEKTKVSKSKDQVKPVTSRVPTD